MQWDCKVCRVSGRAVAFVALLMWGACAGRSHDLDWLSEVAENPTGGQNPESPQSPPTGENPPGTEPPPLTQRQPTSQDPQPQEPTPPDPVPETPPSTPTPIPACVVSDLGDALGAGLASGSTLGQPNSFAGSCGGAWARDVAYLWRAPYRGVFTFDTTGSHYDTVLYLWEANAECAPAEFSNACNDDGYEDVESTVTLELNGGDRVIVIVDGYDEYQAGYYVLNITEANAVPLERDCWDGVDNDNDGLYDCSDDDCQRAGACPPPPPTIPADPPTGPPTVPPTPVACDPMDLGSELGAGVAFGNNQGESQLTGSCGGWGPETLFRWTAPYAGEFVFDTLGSRMDTVLYLRRDAPQCNGPELYGACNDDWMDLDSSVSAYLEEGQVVLIVVDSFDVGQMGPAVLNIAPQRPPDENCWDGVDNDRDGRVDCSDTDCSGHEACSEEPVPPPPDPPMEPYCGLQYLGDVTGRSVARGLTAGEDNRTGGSCGGWESPEVRLWWTAPHSGVFAFDTFGSNYDTLLYLLWAAPECDFQEIPDACNDDAREVLQSSVLAWLDAGDDVIIVVDGYDGAGGYNLNITETEQTSEPVARETDCRDGWDDDGDGSVDCEDPDCYQDCQF